MTLTRRTIVDAAAYALSLVGKTRLSMPVPWTADASVDDCARFCSHVLWGGKPGPISWVDTFKSAGDGSYAAGDTDLQPWDVVLFDWEHNGVGNHVEFMVADLGNGTIRTYGANGSDTVAAAYRIRTKTYVLGRFRPAWSPVSSSPTATPQKTPITTNRRPRMSHILQAPYRKGGPRYSVLIEPGTATLLNSERFAYWSGLHDGSGVKLYPVIQGNERSLALAREHRKTVSNGIKLR